MSYMDHKIEELENRVRELEAALKPFAELHPYSRNLSPEKILSLHLFNTSTLDDVTFGRLKDKDNKHQSLTYKNILDAQKALGGLPNLCSHNGELRYIAGNDYATCSKCNGKVSVLQQRESK